MPQDMQEVYEILINLKADWSKTLGKQTKLFDNFIRKANTSSRTLEKSIGGMQTTLIKTYEGMFDKSQKKLENFTQFANTSLKGISSSTQNLMRGIETLQSRTGKIVRDNQKKIEEYKKRATNIMEGDSKLPGLKAGRIEEFKRKTEALIARNDKLLKNADSAITKMLADNFNKVSEGVRGKTRAVSRGTKQLIDDQIAQFNKLKNYAGMLGQVGGLAEKAKGIKGMEAQQKGVYANLKQLAEAHATAQKIYDQQIILSGKQKNDKLKQHHKDLASFAKINLREIAKEYLETARKAGVFTKQIRASKEELKKPAKGIYEGMVKELNPSKIKALFDPLFANLNVKAGLAGKNMVDSLLAAAKRGDALEANLVKFKNRLAEIKVEAGSLAKMGLIDPEKIGPKLKRAERMVKEFSDGLRKAQSDLAKFSPKKLSEFKVPELGGMQKIRNEIQGLVKDLPALGRVTSQNFEDTVLKIKKIEALMSEHIKNRRTARKKIEDIEKESARVEKMIGSVSSESLRNTMAKNVNTLTKHAQNLRKVLNRDIKFDKTKLEASQAEIIGIVRKTVDRIRGITSGQTMASPNEMFSGIKNQYKALSYEIDKLRNKKFISKETIAQGQAQVDKLKKSVLNYRDTIRLLENELKQLEKLQRAGFRNEGIRSQKALLKEQIGTMRSHMSEVGRMSHQASRRIEQVQTSSLKGMIRGSWEMIRNFRWQVAAVVYLVSRAIQAVKRVFLDVMDEIAKFRRDAMSLAAQYSFKMFGDMKKNFDNAYKHSRKIMQMMEVVAAETILTMEDMMMLTKTFAQAGVIPKTDEDLRKIATIGTAIKALTEGMANAGVQMKQELYAIIAGRQRATDQLAMMFKLMGTNIQEMIDTGRKEGKKMFEVLADALQPFSIMNEALKYEWEAVINKLQIVWKMIKRLALEQSLLQATKSLLNFIDSYWTKAEGLTEKGRMAAAALRSGFEIIKAYADGAWAMVKNILAALGSVVTTVTSLLGINISLNTQMSVTAQKMSGILQATQGLLKIIWLVKHTWVAIGAVVEGVLAPIDYLVEAVKALGAYAAYAGLQMLSWVTFSKQARENLKETANKQYAAGDAILKSATERLSNAGNALSNLTKNANKEYKEIETTMEDIVKLLDKAAKATEDMGYEWELPFPTGVADEWIKMKNEMKSAEMEQYKGPKRFEVEARQKLDALEDLKLKTKANVTALNQLWQDHLDHKVTLNEKDMKGYNNMVEAHKKVTGEVASYETWVLNARDRKTAEFYRKEEISMAKRKKKYEEFMRDALETPMTPKEKAKDWFEDKKIDLKELIVSSEFFRKNIDKVNDALNKGFKLREDNAMVKMNLEAEKFINQASKASAWNNVFDNLNLEFVEYINNVEKSMNLEKSRKPELIVQLNIIKGQRIAQEQLNLVHSAYLKQLEVQSKKADFLKGSYSPIKQRQGEILALNITHKKEMAEMSKSIDEYNKQWKLNGQWKKDATASVIAEGKAMEDMMKEMTKVTERELQKKQMPIWNDLTEASKGWADGFTDALSNIVDGVGSVQEALNELQKTIIKDVLKTVIKRTITDNLQDMLGSGFLGDETPFQKMFGGKKKEEKAQEITVKKPLPVNVVNIKGLLDSTVKKFEPVEKIIVPEMLPPQEIFATKPLPVYITNMTNIPTGVLGTGQYPKDVPFSVEGLRPEDQFLKTSNPIPVFVTNMGEGGMGGMGSIAELYAASGGGSDSGSGMDSTIGASQDLADIAVEIAASTAKASASTKTWYSGFTDVLGSIGNKISGLFGGGSGGSGGGGETDWGSWLSMGMQAASIFMAEGGVISEPIVGKGMKSGSVYNFGEKTKYGEDEMIAPMKKLQKSAPQNRFEYNMPIYLSAIDTQSGVQFLMKHSDVIQNNFTKNLRQNKPIRRGIQNAY